MIYLAKKDKIVGILFIMVALICLIVIGIVVNAILVSQSKSLMSIAIVMLILMLLLGWLWFGTIYSVDNEILTYKSGPIKGNIPVKKILKITQHKTLMMGLKPALAKGGVIINYGDWKEVYIAPVASQKMIEHLLHINPNIQVVNSN